MKSLNFNLFRAAINYAKNGYLPITHCFFQKITDEQLEIIQSEESQNDEKIICKACQHPITSHENRIEVNGQHQHVFSNPIGVVYEIGCFSSTNGCVNKGVPTLEHSWFKGFAWRFVLCSNCYSHLGWFYQSENDSFYGLILDALETF